MLAGRNGLENAEARLFTAILKLNVFASSRRSAQTLAQLRAHVVDPCVGDTHVYTDKSNLTMDRLSVFVHGCLKDKLYDYPVSQLRFKLQKYKWPSFKYNYSMNRLNNFLNLLECSNTFFPELVQTDLDWRKDFIFDPDLYFFGLFYFSLVLLVCKNHTGRKLRGSQLIWKQ